MSPDPERHRFQALLTRELAGYLQLSAPQLLSLWEHYLLVKRWARKISLISETGLEDIVRKHYCESLFLAAHLPRGPLSLADVGSGAGFPGIPVAVFRQDSRLTLIESRSRKVVFLKEATRHLPNVTVVHSRAESLDLEFDWLISRAVAWDEISRLVPRLSGRVALLVSQRTADSLLKSRMIYWDPPVTIPWRRESALLMGRWFHVEQRQ